MPAAPVVPGPTGFEPLPPSHAGLAGPIQVAHCAKVLPAPPATDPAEAPLRVGAHLIRMDYLLPEVRFKGNAYGASFSYDPRASRAAFGSYRDPHVARTLGVFDATDRYVADADWSQLDIDRAIIATAKDDFRPVRPSQATGAALQRHLGGTTPELQQRRYESLRRVTPRAVKEALADLLAPSEQTSVCVVSSRQKLEQANQELEQPLDVRDILRPGAGAGAGEQRLV
jgi:Zn-dependent M16 (insulinase) family peptidase